MEKGSGFLVDTKGICLMCFREKQTKIRVNNPPVSTAVTTNEKNNESEGSQNDFIELIVEDSNGNLNPVKVKNESGSATTTAPAEVNDKVSAFSFRVLTRYLRVNLQKVFSLNVPFHSLHLLDKTELTVSLCPKCVVVADSFVKLCQELELIQMRIQGCLRKVHEVISQAENDKGLVDNYRKQMVTPNPLDLIQAGIVDNLRKEILEKCTRRMQKAFPRVRLEKVKVSLTEKASSLTPNIDIPTLDLTAILTEANYLESIRRSASVIFTSSMKSSQDQGPIPINGNLQLETVIAPPSDPNSVENMDVFNEICDEIEIQSTSMTPPSSSSLQCDNGVLDPMQCDNGNGMLDPLGDPFPVEEEEATMLEEVSSPPTQHEQPEETDENDKDDYVKLCKRIVKGQPRFYCELCNQRVTSRQKHKRVVHREGLLKCAYCNRGFSEYRERKLHTIIQHHYEKYLIPMKPAHMTDESYKEVTEACFGIITENRKDYSCPICGKSHRKTPNLRGHVVEHHFDLYKAKLDGLLNMNSTQQQQQQPSIITYSIALPQNGNNNLLQFSSCIDDKLPDLELIADADKSIEALDQTFTQEDLNQSLLSDLEFTMSSSHMESSISEGSQSPALSQQQSQVEVEKDEEDEGLGKGGKSKYIVITGRKQDGRPLYFCNICKKSVTNTIMHKRIHHGEKLLHCEHCKKEVTTAYILREHTAQFHPTELFKSLKNEQCSEEQFAKFVDILIKDLIKKAIELKNPGEKQKCPLCLKECKQKGRWYLHLMDQHLPGLSEKLLEIQKRELGSVPVVERKVEEKVQQVIVVQFQSPSATINTTPKKIAPVKVSTPASTLPKATTTSPSQSKQAQSDKGKGSSTPKGSYSEKHRFTCDSCGSRFTQSSSLKRHEKLYCKVNKSQETVVPSDSKNDIEYHPLLTPNIATTLSEEPLTASPKVEASCSKPIEPIIATPSSSSIADGLTTIDTSSLSWSIGSTAGGGNLGCSYCDKTFMFPYCQRTHLITAHRVETFSEHVPIGTSYEEVETVLSIILQDFLKTPNGMNSCNFCSKEYAQVSELESHCLISHFDEVVTKLKNLVQLREELILNPNFGASFDNFNLLNEDCVIEGNEELVGGGEGETGDVADVQIFDLDQFPELREIYSSLSGGGAGGDGGDIAGGGGDQDGIGMGIEQVMSAGNTNNDISMGDQLFF